MSVVADIIPLLYIQIFISLSSLEFIQELEEIGLILEHWNPWKLLTIVMGGGVDSTPFGLWSLQYWSEGSQILVQFIFYSNNESSECSGHKGCPRKTSSQSSWFCLLHWFAQTNIDGNDRQWWHWWAMMAMKAMMSLKI